MPFALVTRWKTYRARKLIEKHPILGPTAKFITSILNDPNEYLYALTAENKTKHHEEILEDVIESLRDQHPALAVRKRLSTYVNLGAYAVVLLKNPGQNERPEITGEIKVHLPELIKVSKELKLVLAGTAEKTETVEDIVAVLTAKAHFFDLWMRVYNYVRILLDDCHPDPKKDWFAPYRMAQLIFCEYVYRKELNLPTNIKTGDPITEGIGEMIVYGKFEKFVTEGYEDPRGLFEKEWIRVCHYPCPLADIV